MVGIIFDYLGSISVSAIQFVADDSVGQLQTEGEDLLADLTRQLHVLYEDHRKADGDCRSGWDEVRKFLDLFPHGES